MFNLLCRGDHYREDLHHGSYHCRATNRLGTIFSKTVKVNAGKHNGETTTNTFDEKTFSFLAFILYRNQVFVTKLLVCPS